MVLPKQWLSLSGQAGKLVVLQEVPKHMLVFPLTLLPHKPAASTKVKA